MIGELHKRFRMLLVTSTCNKKFKFQKFVNQWEDPVQTEWLRNFSPAQERMSASAILDLKWTKCAGKDPEVVVCQKLRGPNFSGYFCRLVDAQIDRMRSEVPVLSERHIYNLYYTLYIQRVHSMNIIHHNHHPRTWTKNTCTQARSVQQKLILT